MSIATISTEASKSTNECNQISGLWENEPGLLEIERNDENEITIHMRHIDSKEASLSGSMTRAGAVSLAYTLLAAAAPDEC